MRRLSVQHQGVIELVDYGFVDDFSGHQNPSTFRLSDVLIPAALSQHRHFQAIKNGREYSYMAHHTHTGHAPFRRGIFGSDVRTYCLQIRIKEHAGKMMSVIFPAHCTTKLTEHYTDPTISPCRLSPSPPPAHQPPAFSVAAFASRRHNNRFRGQEQRRIEQYQPVDFRFARLYRSNGTKPTLPNSRLRWGSIVFSWL